MIATKTRNDIQNRKTSSQFETIPTLLEIRRRVKEIRNDWSNEERQQRSHVGQQRLDDLAAVLGFAR